ncbi:pyruvate/2-oxoglutarate dehydrogenase complex, dihydrolipoamide acyltransferase component [Pseudarthrobacter phenanthrenivorans Sphe3]|uniref:Dihydrolipoamide acetyltransferase component of pyruvate dehydrogenase complex n=1 Tax=Pseudarthrobacter phenanthrenivorans (strain DSM 18606 / JCM 16027 / LMG 23796 / Sphe3) TaxID=930171 RepID=F0M5F6_PSEPM|nr:2-oxo acid dehydrogenase subunit E2 [Pseudarthrobacter phenanthrenivorans]ADX71288.1 pyruvate/2-oxoglutarate dehydrogenase complex, dihydrolipoamide acyltransferase component [Pseudarthrobacter phenanthrenivorans Sphe3]
MGEFRMPSLGADMDHGKMVEWLVKPGDYVHRGDVVAVVDTDKTVMDIETFEEGVVAELLVDIGTTVPIGTPLARITATPDDGTAPPAPGAPQEARMENHALVSPPVRHLAHQLGVDPAAIRGTGKHGAVTRADVEHAAAPSGAPGDTARQAGQEAMPAAAAARPGRVRSSPRARRLAAERGLDIASLAGSGPGGAVTEDDVLRAPAAIAPTGPEPAGQAATATEETAPGQIPPEPAGQDQAGQEAAPAPAVAAVPAAEGREREAGLRRAVGALMSKSKKTIPHYYLSSTLDMGPAMAWMQSVNLQRPVSARLVPSALLLKAAALAAKAVPEVNGFYLDDEFRPSSSVHLGVAVALRKGGIVAPAIHDADQLTVDALMERLRDLVGRARAGRLQRAEMADPTITVTNLGELGVDSVFGVIYPPQVAMVGLGRVMEQAWAHDGMLGVRPVVTATLSADHRVSDGLRGARYLAQLDELLQKPEEL